METIQQQLNALQTSAKRQRLLNIALLGIIVAGGFIAAVRPVGDATFETITCNKWQVVDNDGKMRIAAVTLADGETGVFWYDKDGKGRITAGTLTDGSATAQWNDKDGKLRINAGTFANGDAAVVWLDKDGKLRIGAVTGANGTLGLPTEDLTPPKP